MFNIFRFKTLALKIENDPILPKVQGFKIIPTNLSSYLIIVLTVRMYDISWVEWRAFNLFLIIYYNSEFQSQQN